MFLSQMIMLPRCLSISRNTHVFIELTFSYIFEKECKKNFFILKTAAVHVQIKLHSKDLNKISVRYLKKLLSEDAVNRRMFRDINQI